MTAGAAQGLDAIGRANPEWSGWLAVLGEARREAARPEWTAAVPEPGAGDACLLDGTTLPVPGEALARLAQAIARVAWGVAPAIPRLSREDALSLVQAALEQDDADLGATAERLGQPVPLVITLASLFASPLLLACARAWSDRIPPGWSRGSCPVCAAWPVFAEVRGLERARHLRCGRCGAGWPGDWLRCAFCGAVDHERLGALMPGAERERWHVDTCDACRGYLKSVTTLAGTPPAEIALRDLETVELDLVALDRGYRRPSTPAHRARVACVLASETRGRVAGRR